MAAGQVGNLDPGAQNIHLQALLDVRQQIGSQQGPKVGSIAIEEEARQHPPLGRAPGRMLGRTGGEMIDVAGQLVVQEGLCLFARTFDEAEMHKGRNDRRIACACQFGDDVAKIRNQSVIDPCAGDTKKFLPDGVHCCIFPQDIFKQG